MFRVSSYLTQKTKHASKIHFTSGRRRQRNKRILIYLRIYLFRLRSSPLHTDPHYIPRPKSISFYNELILDLFRVVDTKNVLVKKQRLTYSLSPITYTINTISFAVKEVIHSFTFNLKKRRGARLHSLGSCGTTKQKM